MTSTVQTKITTFLTIMFLAVFSFPVKTEVPISSPVNYIEQSFDVIHYSAYLDFSNAPMTNMSGLSKIKIYWKTNPSSNLFYFHLEDLKVDSIFYNSKKTDLLIKFDTNSESNYYAVIPPDSAIRDTAMVMIYYHGLMTNADQFGGVWSSKDLLFAVGVGFRNRYVSSTRHWLACYDHPSDKATFDFTFITPENMTVASNGLKQSEEIVTLNNTAKRRTVWSSQFPIATNLMTFAVASFSVINTENNNIPIVIYTRKADSVASAFVYKKVPDMLRTMESHYGPYPFDKAGYVNTTISGGAMEHQTMITMNVNEIIALYTAKDTLNETAAHELAHQWFGNSVTPFDYRDAWFNEGFATFATNVWIEDLFDYKHYLFRIGSQINNYINYYSKTEGIFPLYDYPRAYPSSNYPTTIYVKGCAVIGMLRYELGDSLFFTLIRKFLETYRNSNITTNMLKEFLSDKSGKDLTWFFDQWIYGTGFPVLDVKVKKTKSAISGKFKAEINITQTQKWGIYSNVPLEISFFGLDGSEADTVIRLNNKENFFVFDSLPDFQNPSLNNGQVLRSLIKVNTLTTYVNESDKTAGNISIYPNPVNDILSVHCNDIKFKSDYSITDINGEKRQSGTIVSHGQDSIDIDISKLEIGSYYLTIESSNYIKTFYFIISR